MPMGTPFPVASAEELSPAARSIDATHARIKAAWAEAAKEPEPTPPAPLPAGIAEKTRLEIEEGRRRNAMALANRAQAQPPKKDPSEGTTEPVYRPGEFVPNMEQGHIPTKSYKVL